MKVVLTQGKFALIDREDYPKIAPYKWCYHAIQGYAIATVYYVNPRRDRGQTTFGMHRIITNAPVGIEVDHINGDKLDNRKQNLRLCLKRSNQANTGPRRHNKSGYKGVCLDKESGKFKAQININGRRKSLGRYNTPEEAALIYNEAAIAEYGEFAWVNQIKRTL